MKKTFTLIELMIVIAIIAIIAAIAIPNLVEARKAGNEAAAIGTCRTVASAQALFREGDRDADGVIDYADSMGDLGSADLVDEDLATGTKSGYVFAVSSTGNFNWAMTADAQDNQGGRDFFTNESGIIRFAAAGSASTATANSSSSSIGS